MPGPQEYDVHMAGFDELDARTGYALWRLRETVFVVEQRCAYLELDGRDLEPGTRHVWAVDAGLPVGYLRTLEDADAVRIGRVLVAASHRGRGVAGLLMQHALRVVGEDRSTLDAQSYLAPWYTRFGFAPSGAEFVEDGIPHVPMTREASTGP